MGYPIYHHTNSYNNYVDTHYSTVMVARSWTSMFVVRVWSLAISSLRRPRQRHTAAVSRCTVPSVLRLVPCVWHGLFINYTLPHLPLVIFRKRPSSSVRKQLVIFFWCSFPVGSRDISCPTVIIASVSSCPFKNIRV